jgi:hypothetical protein
MPILLVGVGLLAGLLQRDARPRTGTRDRYETRQIGRPFAVVVGSQLLILSMALVPMIEVPSQAADWARLGLAVPCPLIAYGLVRAHSAPRVTWRHPVMAVRAGGLIAVVVLAEWLVIDFDGPLLPDVWRLNATALAVTAGYLGFLISFDEGYWPVPLVRLGLMNASLAGLTIWLLADAGTVPLDIRSRSAGEQMAAMLLWAFCLLTAMQLLLGGWRLVRWLLRGPPGRPGPPGIRDWPPVAGEVWNVLLPHEDGNFKDRPVLVLERKRHHVDVLKFTTVDKAGSRFHIALNGRDWVGVLDKPRFLSLDITPVPFSEFRICRGQCTESFWQRINRNQSVKERPSDGTPPAGFSFRHRLHSSRNKHIGRNERRT